MARADHVTPITARATVTHVLSCDGEPLRKGLSRLHAFALLRLQEPRILRRDGRCARAQDRYRGRSIHRNGDVVVVDFDKSSSRYGVELGTSQFIHLSHYRLRFLVEER
jgi:hypothetical protein